MRPRSFVLRCFSALQRRLFSAELVDEYGDEQLDTLDTVLRTTRARGRFQVLRFWIREFAGLTRLAVADRWAIHAARRAHLSQLHPDPRKPDMLHELRKDLFFAFRMIRKTPIIAAIAIVSVALGVSINISTFAMLNAWLVRPLPYPDADRLILAYEIEQSRPDDLNGVAVANLFDWQERATSFETWIVARFGTKNMTGVDRPEQLTTADVTPNMFRELGTQTMLGRAFSPDEGGAEDSPVAVLGETLWRTKFGADSAVMGTTITLDGVTHTVIGVVPETFDFLLGSVTLWVANDFLAQRDDRETRALNVTARLKPNVTVDQAQAELIGIAGDLAAAYPVVNRDRSVNVQTVREQFPGPTDRGLILILTTVVFLALLIACANVATLMLAKTDARQKELAVRLALGSGKRRIVQQLLIESVVMATISGILGLALAIVGIEGISQAIPEVLPSFFMPRVDGNVVVFAGVVSVFAGLVFGVTPALQAISGNARSALIDGTRGGTASKRKRRIRNAFVVAEFAMALVILIGAAVMTDMFGRSLQIDPGYDPSNVLTMEFTVPEHRYAEDEDVVQVIDDIGRELDGIPGVSSWAFASQLPRTFALPATDFTFDAQPVEEGEEPRTDWLTVSPDYLTTLEIALTSGRTISESDRAETPPVVLVNELFADRLLGNDDPIGARITIAGSSREIVGVVRNVAQTRLAGLEPVDPTVYLPITQRPLRRLRALLKTETNPHDVAADVQAAVWQVDPEQPITAVQTLEEFIEVQLAGPDMLNGLLFTVGILALALSAIGIYGVMAYSVSQQTNELGIRMALGAKPGQVLSRVTRQGTLLTGIGLLLGTPAAILVTRAIMNMPAGIPGVDVVEMGIAVGPVLTVSAILVSVGLLACILPARRATRIDPALALREE